MDQIACFHCAEPVPPGVRLFAHVNQRDRAVCCVGCRAAAEWITALGLGDYYHLRDVPAERAVPPADFGAWDRSQLQRLYVRERGDGSAEVCMLVQGLRCAACSWLIDRALRDASGVEDVQVNVAARRLQLVWRPQVTSLSVLLKKIARLGYTPHPLNAEALDAVQRDEQRTALKRLVVAGLGMMQSMMYAVALYAGAFDGMDPLTRDFFRWLGLLVSTPVILYAGAPFFSGAWREWCVPRVGMDTPVALAIAAVFAASLIETVRGGAQVYFDSASMFVFLLLGARYVEMHSRHRAADVVDALARLQPATAQRRRSDGGLEMVGTHELETGDVVTVDAGATVPADGTLINGACDVDEALLSGEATPRHRRDGEKLVAGSVLRSGPVDMRVVHVGAETVLSSIVRLVSRAQRQRPRLTQLGDALAARFVAGVLVLTALTIAGWLLVDPVRAFPAALAVLVVSCPCAFALAVPAATTRATAILARCGVLVLKPDALEKLVRLTHCIFDKTGTLTRGRSELLNVLSLAHVSADECLRIAAAIEESNGHPLAHAIRDAAARLPALHATELHHELAAGVEGSIAGRRYRLGQAAFALPGGGDGNDGVVLADAFGALARFEFRESLRADAQFTLQALRTDGVALEISSGDEPGRVTRVAQHLRIANWCARATPAMKLAHLQQLRTGGAVVGMVGDGVNDAPVLAGADVAVALGDGAQLAQSSADIVLAGDRLGALVDARRIAAQTERVLRQNLYWAFGYNLLSVPLAALGFVPPWLAAIGMSLSSLLVVLNSFRIRVAAPVREPIDEIAPVKVAHA